MLEIGNANHLFVLNQIFLQLFHDFDSENDPLIDAVPVKYLEV